VRGVRAVPCHAPPDASSRRNRQSKTGVTPPQRGRGVHTGRLILSDENMFVRSGRRPMRPMCLSPSYMYGSHVSPGSPSLHAGKL